MLQCYEATMFCAALALALTFQPLPWPSVLRETIACPAVGSGWFSCPLHRHRSTTPRPRHNPTSGYHSRFVDASWNHFVFKRGHKPEALEEYACNFTNSDGLDKFHYSNSWVCVPFCWKEQSLGCPIFFLLCIWFFGQLPDVKGQFPIFSQ